MNHKEFLDLHAQASEMIEQGNFRDAFSLYDMALHQVEPDLRPNARSAMASALNQYTEAVSGQNGSLNVAEQNYSSIKQLAQANLEDAAYLWTAQVPAVVAAMYALYNYDGPRGVGGFLASVGNGPSSGSLGKKEEESYQRLANELLLLTKYAKNCTDEFGGVLAQDFALAGQVALQVMQVFDERRRQAPTYVLDFFLNFPEQQIGYKEQPEGMDREVANLRRLAMARKAAAVR